MRVYPHPFPTGFPRMQVALCSGAKPAGTIAGVSAPAIVSCPNAGGVLAEEEWLMIVLEALTSIWSSRLVIISFYIAPSVEAGML